MQKTSIQRLRYHEQGVTPITKNIYVVDEQGKSLEATYPKRAEDLVKKGRARFISEDTICLVALPNEYGEVAQMTEQYAQSAVEYSIPYILKQIAAIQADTAYLKEAVSKLAAMSDGDSGDCGSPGNIQGQAKAEALGNIVKSRETTNQQILHIYERMYEKLSREREPWRIPGPDAGLAFGEHHSKLKKDPPDVSEAE